MISRRNFLIHTGLLSAATLISPNFAFAKSDKKIGIQLYTLRDELPKNLIGVIEAVAKAGYQEIETFDFTKDQQFWGMATQDFKKLLDANGLKAVSGHFSLGTYLTNGNTDELWATLKASKILESSFITIPSIPAALTKNAEGYKKVAQTFNQLGKICKNEGLRLAYHNHNSEFKKQGETSGYEILLKETDQNLVDFELDLYWATRAGINPIDLFKKYPNRFPLWHIKDMDKQNVNWNTEIGKGTVPFASIFKQASSAGLKHIFVEQETNYMPNINQSIKNSYDFIHNHLY